MTNLVEINTQSQVQNVYDCLDTRLKVMGTIASELKAPSQNTPHSSIII